jgi:hypothetical protein
MNNVKTPLGAVVLGYAGLVPFLALTALHLSGYEPPRRTALEDFLIYGGIILSFLGGIRWGTAAAFASRPGPALLFAVAPSLWAAFFLWWASPQVAVAGLLAGFILMGLADWWWPGVRTPAWMRELRIRLTLLVSVCHLAVLAAF